MAEAPQKSDQAFKTIGELADDLGVPQHILRYWETRFPQLRPLQRAGNRRYYRPADVALAHRIHQLLNKDGYTIRGVQQVLSSKAAAGKSAPPPASQPAPVPASSPASAAAPQASAVSADELRSVRTQLARALDESAI